MQRTTRLTLGTAAAVLTGAVLLAACGGSGTEHPSSAPAATSPRTAPASPATTVTSKHDTKLGTILADAQGLTLYTLTNNGKPVDCTGPCATTWPPLTVASGAMPTAAPGAGVVGMATLSDGTSVVTSGGLPLYRFAKDHDAGDAYGEGLASFGGVWHVVKAVESTATSSDY